MREFLAKLNLLVARWNSSWNLVLPGTWKQSCSIKRSTSISMFNLLINFDQISFKNEKPTILCGKLHKLGQIKSLNQKYVFNLWLFIIMHKRFWSTRIYLNNIWLKLQKWMFLCFWFKLNYEVDNNSLVIIVNTVRFITCITFK